MMAKKTGHRPVARLTNEKMAKASTKTGGTNVSAGITPRRPRSGSANPTKY